MRSLIKNGFALLTLIAFLLVTSASGAFADVFKGKEPLTAGSGQSISNSVAGVGTCSQGHSDKRLEINNVRVRILNMGGLFWDGDPNVYEVPINTGKMALFAGGIWIGGQVDGKLRIAAARYSNWEFWPGPLKEDADGDGFPEAPANCATYDRIFKVSKDDLKAFKDTGEATSDMKDWPYDLGAPVTDGDGNPNNYNLAGGDLPEMIGDQMLWWVMNDMGNKHTSTNADPIGIEAQVTAFAFRQAGDLGNMTFYRYKLIYKGKATLKDTYMTIWSDPDLGDASDDYVGSDTTLGLGYVWNADNDDGTYKSQPPAVGYDFFRGPITDQNGDGKLDTLGMSTFSYFENSSGDNGDPETGKGIQYYYAMQARNKTGQSLTFGGRGFTAGNKPVRYAFPGDPVTGQGWTEQTPVTTATPNAPSDRRFVMSAGPFTLKPGETQSIVYGIVFGQGANRFESVARMKLADIKAQRLFDSNFKTAPPPDAPRVNVSSVDGDAYLTWGYNATDNNYLNTYQESDPIIPPNQGLATDYIFQGYVVYQYDNLADTEGKVIAVYDADADTDTHNHGQPVGAIYDAGADPNTTELVVNGGNSGVQTFHAVKGLTNYQTYYFGVQAYAYNQDSVPKVLASPVTRLTVVPSKIAAKNGGTTVTATLGQTLASESIGLPTDGSATVRVVNPAAVTGNEYNVVFYDYTLNKVNVVGYDIINKTTGAKVFDGRKAMESTGAELPLATPVAIIDGLEFTVNGAPFTYKDFLTMSNAKGPLANCYGAFAFNGSGFPHPSLPNADRPCAGQQSANASQWGIHTNPDASDISFTRFVARSLRNDNPTRAIPYDFELRFTAAGGKAEAAFTSGAIVDVPFELWNIGVVGTGANDTKDDFRMVAFFNDADGNDKFNLLNADHTISGGTNDPYTDWIYWYEPVNKAAGDAGYKAFLADPNAVGKEVMARMVLVNFNGGNTGATFPTGVNSLMPESGTTFRIVTTKPNVPGVVHKIDTKAIAVKTAQSDVASAALDLIGVVPNPYKGQSNYETRNVEDIVRFTNLPKDYTIRVFTLDGTLVRTLQKSGPDATLQWDLSNDGGLRLASGMYLIHVDVPNLGEKVIKFGVVRKKVQLVNF